MRTRRSASRTRRQPWLTAAPTPSSALPCSATRSPPGQSSGRSVWRAVIAIGDDTPSGTAIEANAHALDRYAALCQENGLVPMVEPEVLIDGSHDIDISYEVTEATLRSVFGALYEHNVMLEGTILKVGFVTAGKDCPEPSSAEEVAEAARSAGLVADVSSSVEQALRTIAARDWPAPPRILICGSLYLAGEVLSDNGTPPT